MRLKLLALGLLWALPVEAAEPGLLEQQDALDSRRNDAEAVKAHILQGQAGGATQKKLKTVLGKQTWEAGDKAAKLQPARVEGHYLAACGMGSLFSGVRPEAIEKVEQGSTAYNPAEGQCAQQWAKQVDADIQEELK